MRFDISSRLAETLFRKEKCFYNMRINEYSTNKSELKYWREDSDSNIKEVIILQMIICGEREVIAELILKEDFDKYFEINEDEMFKEVKLDQHMIDPEDE